MGIGPNDIVLALPFILASCRVGAEQPVSTQIMINITMSTMAVDSLLRCI